MNKKSIMDIEARECYFRPEETVFAIRKIGCTSPAPSPPLVAENDQRVHVKRGGAARGRSSDSFEFRLIFEFGDCPNAFCHRRPTDVVMTDDTYRAPPSEPHKSRPLYLSPCVLVSRASARVRRSVRSYRENINVVTYRLQLHDGRGR